MVAAALPPYDVHVLAWVGLSPLLFAMRQGAPLKAGFLAFLFGACFAAGAFFWSRSVESVSLSNILVFLLLMGLYSFAFGYTYRLLAEFRESWMVFGAPALWVSVETLRSNLDFLAWPWNLLGHSQHLFLQVIQVADVTGVYGVSFVIVMVNQVLSEVPGLFTPGRTPMHLDRQVASARGSWSLRLLVTVLVLGAVFSYGTNRMARPVGDRHIRVALVQANVVARDDMPLADQRQHLLAYERVTMEAAQGRPHLIVWPSSSLPAAMSASRMVRFTVSRLAQRAGCPLLVGGAGYEKLKPREERFLPYSNSEFLIAPSGRIMGQYNKIRLLPFNETVPLSGIITWPRWITTARESFIAGDKYTLFEVDGARFGTPICWENMFSDLFRRFVRDGANFMVSVSNEAFMGSTGGAHQSLAINCFRAVENRVAVVRATTTGVSAFIGSNGAIVERVADSSGSDLFVSGYLVRDVPLSDAKTFYTLHGDVFAFGAMAAGALAILAALVSRRRPAPTREDPHAR